MTGISVDPAIDYLKINGKVDPEMRNNINNPQSHNEAATRKRIKKRKYLCCFGRGRSHLEVYFMVIFLIRISFFLMRSQVFYTCVVGIDLFHQGFKRNGIL